MEIVKNSVVANKLKTKGLKVLVLLLLTILLYGVNNTYIYYTNLIPFGAGVVFALLYIGFNGYILAGIYAFSCIFSGINISSIVLSISVGLVLSIVQCLIARQKLSLTRWKVFILTFVSLLGYMVCNVKESKTIIALMVSVVLAMFFLYSCLCFLDATFGRGMLGRINLDEKICGGVVLLVFSIGISSLNIGAFSLGYFFITIIILACTHVCKYGVTLIIGCVVGLGFGIGRGNSLFVSMFVILTLSSVAFRCRFKFLSAISTIFSYMIFSLLFSTGISVGELAGVVLGGIVFVLIPTRLLSAVSEIFVASRSVAVQNLFNSSKSELVSRVKDLSIVFGEMNKVYRGMVRGNLADNNAKQMLKEEAIVNVCGSCANKDSCFRSSGSFMDNCFDAFIDVAYEKGKALLIDLPEYMTTNCSKVNQLLMYVNSLISTYLDYRGAVTNIDTSRILIADQLCGVSKLLEALSKEVDINVKFDNKYESMVIENLGYVGVLCVECVVYEKDIQSKTISLIVKTSTYNDKKIEKIVNKITRSKFKIESIEEGAIIGTTNVVLKNRANYDISFGAVTITKSGQKISGDNHMVAPIGEGKYIVSICDGMGSGAKANDISSLTIKLIENFYRAGFDNDIILSSVNKLLSLTEQDNFSTIDLCVIDGRKNIYDFIKLGATSGYIRRSSGDIEIISSSGLPVGVLESIRPHITKKCISPMDMIVLVSDGVSDVLGDNLKVIIRNSDIANPQLLSEDILQKAIESSGGIPNDDMTVVCVRVFECA